MSIHVLFFFSLSLFVLGAEARTSRPCNSLIECVALKDVVDQTFIEFWKAEARQWASAKIIGKVLSFSGANNHCKSSGGRIPSPREFAELAALLGAKGIRETQYPDMFYQSPELKTEIQLLSSIGYKAIYKTNSDGRVGVDFYYNQEGYHPTSNFKYYANFWTSSLDHSYSPPAAYAFAGATGSLESTDPNWFSLFNKVTILCLE